MNFATLLRAYRKPILGLAALIALAAVVSITREHFVGKKDLLTTGDRRPATEVFTCPMHPQVRSDTPGDCPICGMRLVEVQSSVDSRQSPANEDNNTGNRRPTTDDGSVYISPDRQQLIGVRTQRVERKAAVQEIRTVGKVAYDPDLFVAQREYVTALKLGSSALRDAAEAHLRHMGISEDELVKLRKTRTPPTNLFLPKEGESVWVYAPLYEHEFPFVQAGANATITVPTGDASYAGTVRSINPVIDPKTRSAHARIDVPGVGGKLKPETYVNVQISVSFGDKIVVPASAIIDSGVRKVVIVKRDEGLFEPREIQTGPSLGDSFVVASGLDDGEEIVTGAAFLVDSESKLKAALQGHQQHNH